MQEREDSFKTGQKWGSFELLEEVGRGSFGVVYRAWDTQLQREVGLKILLARPGGGGVPFDDLLREARALAAVRHPNILAIYGVDRYGGRVGFWTDFVRGKTLAALVHGQGPFGYREAALMGLDVCKALSAVHRAGLLHRDIKAENVMREEGGRILLMDFGLSSLPLEQARAGTPRYMAPELFTGEQATVASDVYAVGVLLFYLVTGRYPDERPAPQTNSTAAGDEPTLAAPELRSRASQTHRTQNPALPPSRAVHDHRPDIPENFSRVIETAMHSDPAKRYASAGAMSSALAETLGNPVAEKPVERRRPDMRWLGVVVLIVLVAVVYWFRHRGSEAGEKRGAAANVPESVNGQYLKADALLRRYDKRKNVTDAIDVLKGVVAEDPNFSLAQAGLCRAYFLDYRETRVEGLVSQARDACNRAIAIDANLASPYVTLARMDAMAGHNDLAMEQVNKALGIDPRSADAYGAQSEVFNAEGRMDAAIQAAQKAVDLAPDDWRWPVLLGTYYYGAGRLEEAASQYQSAVNISPDNSLALDDLGLADTQLDRLQDAAKYLEKSAEVDPSFSAYSALAEIYKAQGNYQKAIETSKRALDLNTTDYMAWGNLGSAYLRAPDGRDAAMENYRKAIELAEAARRESPQDSLLLAVLGGYYATLGNQARALPLLRQAVTLDPDSADVLYVAGDGYELLHKRDEAIQLIAKALALGYHYAEFEKEPELAALRQDPKFQKALAEARQKHSLDTQNKKG